MSRLFKVTDDISILCDSVGTRYGFRHVAKLMINGYETDKTKVCYYNRTWEAYPFQTVISKLLERTDNSILTPKQKSKFLMRFGR
jgi:hypothetical protein